MSLRSNGVNQLPDAVGLIDTDLLTISREGRWRKLSIPAFVAGVVDKVGEVLIGLGSRLTNIETVIGYGDDVSPTAFWNDVGGPASIAKFRTRVFVGDAVNNTGNRFGTQGGNVAPFPADGANWALRDGTNVTVATNGLLAVVGYQIRWRPVRLRTGTGGCQSGGK